MRYLVPIIWSLKVLKGVLVILTVETSKYQVLLLTDILVREEESNIVHQFDCWHLSKRKLLVTRFQKGEKILTNSEELTTILSTLPGVTTDTVAAWIQEELNSILEQKDQSNPVSWKERYVAKLLELEDLRNEMTTTDNVDSVVVLAKSFKTKRDEEIKKLEKKEKVRKRWLPTDGRFQNIAKKVSLFKLDDLEKDLHKIALGRWFYISLKSKYADGQSIAKKLAKSIAKKTKELRQVLKTYNNHKNSICGLEGNQKQDIELATASDPTSAFFNNQEETAALPLSMKRKAMDLYLMSRRAKGEKALLVQEMQQTIKYYEDLKHGLSKTIAKEEESWTVSLGALSVMRKQLFIITCTLSELTQLFFPFGIGGTSSDIPILSNDGVVFTDSNEFVGDDDDDDDDDDGAN